MAMDHNSQLVHDLDFRCLLYIIEKNQYQNKSHYGNLS